MNSNSGKKINLLFVCLGNICRSPIAEGVFKEKVEKAGLSEWIQCDSAGTSGYHDGHLADIRMRRLAENKGMQLTHLSRKFLVKDFHDFDYILVMDNDNHSNLLSLAQKNNLEDMMRKVMLYRPFDPERGEDEIVPDPYYSKDEKAFNEVYDIVDRAGESLLEFLVKQYGYTIR